jgi:hypothetical protein
MEALMRRFGIPWSRCLVALRLSCILAPAWMTPCAGDNGPLGPDFGAISITTTTSGSEADPDGYLLSLNGAVAQPIGPNATLILSDLPPGTHSLQLAGVAGNCAVSEGAARDVQVTAGATAEVSFAVVCAAAEPPRLPTARMTVTGGGQTVTEGGVMNLTVQRTGDQDTAFVEITADASRSEPGTGSITAYEWQSNGAAISTEPAFTFRLDEGRYVVTLTVTNSAALSHTASVNINVREQ